MSYIKSETNNQPNNYNIKKTFTNSNTNTNIQDLILRNETSELSQYYPKANKKVNWSDKVIIINKSQELTLFDEIITKINTKIEENIISKIENGTHKYNNLPIKNENKFTK